MDDYVQRLSYNPINCTDEVELCKICGDEIKKNEDEYKFCKHCDFCKWCEEYNEECSCFIDKNN